MSCCHQVSFCYRHTAKSEKIRLWDTCLAKQRKTKLLHYAVWDRKIIYHCFITIIIVVAIWIDDNIWFSLFLFLFCNPARVLAWSDKFSQNFVMLNGEFSRFHFFLDLFGLCLVFQVIFLVCHYRVCWLLWKSQLMRMAAGYFLATMSPIPTKLLWGSHNNMPHWDNPEKKES